MLDDNQYQTYLVSSIACTLDFSVHKYFKKVVSN